MEVLPHSLIDECAKTFVASFKDDPYFRAVYKTEDNWEKNAIHQFRFLVCYGLKHGEVYTTSTNVEGSAIWFPSENARLTLYRMIRYGALQFIFNVGLRQTMKMISDANLMDRQHETIAPFPHWYLMLLGVNPNYHGKGLAKSLLLPKLSQFDQTGMPCYLETYNPSNIPIYQRFGFEIHEEVQMPNMDVKLHSMLRQPQ
jgi:ribosomal protein S18 acetylase RimI-like enzyme